MNRRLTSALASGTLAAALALGGLAGSTASADTVDLDLELNLGDVTEFEVEKNGAKALVEAVGDALEDLLDGDLLDGDIDIAVVEVEDSFNNLQALNNVLNNNDIDVDIQDVEVLSDNQIEILNDANIDIDDVIGVDVLDGGDLLVIVD